MKNKCKLLGIAVVIAAIVFSAGLLFTGCDDTSGNANNDSNGDGDGNNNGGGGTTYSGIEAFNTWLSKQPKNTRETPYRVKLNISKDLRNHDLKEWYNADKYVYLDLSGSTITKIEDGTFNLCGTLVGITIGDSVTIIGEKAFSYSDLTSVIIGSGVTSMGEKAFEHCWGLSSLTIKNGAADIGAGAFGYCQKLTSVNIPGSVKSIGESAFVNCTGITSLTLENGVTNIGVNAFYGCTGITGVIIPDSVTSLSGFSYCANLASVTIGNNVKSIENRAFTACSKLKSVTIPSSVTSIGNGAFYDGWWFGEPIIGLTSVTFEGTIPSSGFYVENRQVYGSLPAFPGDLRTKFYATDSTNGTPGTYTRPNDSSSTWTKKKSEDGGAGNSDDEKITINDWTWSKSDDSEDGGISTITMTQGTGADSEKLTFSGNAKKIPGETYGYAQWTIEPNAANLAALKSADSFSFKCKGDGKKYNVEVRTTDISDYAYYMYQFTASNTENTVVISYSSLTQPTWGNKKNFNKANISNIVFQIRPDVNGEGAFNITVWDLQVN